MFDVGAAFFSTAGVFDLAEELLVHGYAYVVLHDCELLTLCILGILKSFISFTQQKKHRSHT